jgi:hypothetical protein
MRGVDFCRDDKSIALITHQNFLDGVLVLKITLLETYRPSLEPSGEWTFHYVKA